MILLFTAHFTSIENNVEYGWNCAHEIRYPFTDRDTHASREFVYKRYMFAFCQYNNCWGYIRLTLCCHPFSSDTFYVYVLLCYCAIHKHSMIKSGEKVQRWLKSSLDAFRCSCLYMAERRSFSAAVPVKSALFGINFMY